jgi:Electron transfer DM13
MRKLFWGIFSVCILGACSKETLAPETILTEMTDTTATLNNSGQFMNGPYGNVAGYAKIYTTNNGYQVLLDSFTTNNGPDLYIYLSKEVMPVNFVSLGKLKSTAGSQLYDVPANVNLTDYKYVCVHCRQYNHLFGYAFIQ